MKIYDISQEIFSSAVYPGDTPPSMVKDKRISRGDLYNLTSISMSAHNGTHIDAPFHFIENGDTVEAIPLEKTVGMCYVTYQCADICEEAATDILSAASASNPDAGKRILIKGNGTVTANAARVFAAAGVYLIGVESQSVGPENAPMEVHKILLSEKTVLLEGLRLSEVREGVYFLSASPILLGGSDGAPCRAILTEAPTEIYDGRT